MFRLTFRALSALPRLAWCAELTPDGDIFVEHGPWVETGDDFFAEGAWDAPFEDGAIDRAAVVLGSGGRVRNNEVIFCTTTHTMERLQSVRVGDRLFLSNSFAYLLRATGDGLDVNYRYYERDFMTFLRGRRRAKRSVPTRLGRQVSVYYGERIIVGGDLAIRTEPFPPSPPFESYEAYIAAVTELVSRLHLNANSPARAARYQPLSTLSTGYDSPACTVIAKHIGCRDAITVTDARPDYNPYGRAPGDASDDGTQIARHLQIELTAYRRSAYLDRDDYPEAEFIATGNGGDDVVLAAAESELAGRMLFTGFLGDTLWGLHPLDADSSRNYVYQYPAGGTLGEFRIRTGFIHVPIPLLTYASQPSLVRIARSGAMAPWRIGGDYDRPIPRRLVESSGVPRAIYATEKKAITQPFWLPVETADLRKMLSADSYDSLRAYAGSAAVMSALRLPGKLRTSLARLTPPRAARYANWYTSLLHKKLGIRLLPELRTDQFTQRALFASPAGLKFHWAVEKTGVRYDTTRHRLSNRSSTSQSQAVIA